MFSALTLCLRSFFIQDIEKKLGESKETHCIFASWSHLSASDIISGRQYYMYQLCLASNTHTPNKVLLGEKRENIIFCFSWFSLAQAMLGLLKEEIGVITVTNLKQEKLLSWRLDYKESRCVFCSIPVTHSQHQLYWVLYFVL